MAENKDDHLLPAGFRCFNPHENAPEFVVGSIVITMADFLEYWKAHPELQTDYDDKKSGKVKKQMKLQLLVAKSGKLYAKVDDYKPEDKVEGRAPVRPPAGGAAATAATAVSGPAAVAEDDLPF